ncbi:hypothetical protein BMF94_6434 [Rhodotorula taiwanensis]|uniref:Xylanolytic transcriptional activator regulatory domain-containing protein n=1 Tax=Rhodotorula taiwanensis TaxID=741276 RepID=A0A2S5B154_9BASI|nr:hypothetical protein BMF94_6434 [Rhodotorula taiwanensis]
MDTDIDHRSTSAHGVATGLSRRDALATAPFPTNKRSRRTSSSEPSARPRSRAVSCRECVRLKLKVRSNAGTSGGPSADCSSSPQCSREWPCASCVRRGCAQVCPDGELPHRSVFSREAEERAHMLMLVPGRRDASKRASGTEKTAATASLPPPAQQRDDLEAAIQLERLGEAFATVDCYTAANADLAAVPLTASTFDALPLPPARSDTHDFSPSNRHCASPRTPASTLDAAMGCGPGLMETQGSTPRFHGRGAGALFCIDTETVTRFLYIKNWSGEEPDAEDLLIPFGSGYADAAKPAPDLFPPYEQARVYVSLYFEHVDWMYQPCSLPSIERDLCLLYAAKRPLAVTADYGGLHPHRVAVLLLVFGLAETFTRPLIPANALRPPSTSALYFNAATALLCASPCSFLSRPTVAAVKGLHLMVSYLFCSGNREGARSAWTLLGLASRAAQSLGLHKNCAQWDISAEEVEERSRVCWELLTYDLLQSLNFGRPYSIPMHFVQCPMPNSASDAASSPVGSAGTFHWFKYRLALGFGKISDVLATPDLPDYAVVLQLDRELKASEASAPGWLRSAEFPPAQIHDLPEKIVAQKHMLNLLLHKGLLALHRPWFAKALMSGAEPMCTPWAASFNACILSARRHVQIMRSILVSAQRAGLRWWFFLFHTFTSSIIQASVLLRAPSCMLADDIRVDFAQSLQIFREVAPVSALAQRALGILNKVEQALNGETSSIPQLSEPGGYIVTQQANEAAFTTQGRADNIGGSRDTAASASYLSAMSDPAGALLSSIGTPLAWDLSALDWSSLDSISETLLFWNVEHAAGPSGT